MKKVNADNFLKKRHVEYWMTKWHDQLMIMMKVSMFHVPRQCPGPESEMNSWSINSARSLHLCGGGLLPAVCRNCLIFTQSCLCPALPCPGWLHFLSAAQLWHCQDITDINGEHQQKLVRGWQGANCTVCMCWTRWFVGSDVWTQFSGHSCMSPSFLVLFRFVPQ